MVALSGSRASGKAQGLGGTKRAMTTAKYRVAETAHGSFRIGIRAGTTSEGEEAWVPAASDVFPSLESAEEGIKRLVTSRKWHYDADGKRIP